MAVLVIIWKEDHILLPAEAAPVFADSLRGLTLSNSVEKKARLTSFRGLSTLLHTRPAEFVHMHF